MKFLLVVLVLFKCLFVGVLDGEELPLLLLKFSSIVIDLSLNSLSLALMQREHGHVDSVLLSGFEDGAAAVVIEGVGLVHGRLEEVL